MHDEHTCCTTTLRLLELVGPPAVVRHRPCAEAVRLGGRLRRIVHQDEEDFSLDVGIPEIIPLVLGSGCTIADEHQLTARCALSGGTPRPYHDVLGIAQRRRRLARCRHCDRGHIGADDIDGNILEVGAVDAGLDASGTELARDVFGSDASAACGGCASLEKIRAEKAKMSVDFRCRDSRTSLCGCDGGTSQQRGGEDGAIRRRHVLSKVA
ncbi:MAG: hypothetical protein JWL61_3859 [Gemmatimonadetes bacterium]|nr:hypothetical protein [Gemmatimonadota bacterium]